MRAALVLLLVTLFAHAPQLGFDEWRGTEARRVQIAVEMAERGDWMVPRLGGEPTLAKPPVFYWALRTMLWVSSEKWAMRLPSALAFWALALAGFSLLRRTRNERAAWLGGLGIVLAPSLLGNGPTAEIDPLFAALTGISVFWLAEGAAYGRRRRLVAAGLIGGLAFLTKGPPYFVFVAGVLLIWLRRQRLRGLLWYLLPLSVVVAAYYAPLLLWYVSAEELSRTVAEEGLRRVDGTILGRIATLPDYVGRVLAVLLPIGLWTFHEYRGAVEVREVDVKPDEAVLRLCAGAALAALGLMLFVAHRPSRYIMPAAPLWICAVAPAVAAYGMHRVALTPGLAGVLRFASVVGGVGLLALPWVPQPFPWRTPALLLTLGLGPLLVRRREQIAPFLLVVVPLVAAWTFLPDRLQWERERNTWHTPAARALAREAQALGVDDLGSRGHVPSQVLVEWGRYPAGDEFCRRPPQSEWLLFEDPDQEVEFDASETSGYDARVRVRLNDKTLVLGQRR